MSRIKNLFDGKGSGKILVNTNLNEAGRSVESADFAKAKVQQINRFLPNINYSTASNFVVYGSAEKYYIDSINYIKNEYPYDGSLREKVEWELNGTYLDKYLLDNEYPRTNGYINLGLDYTRGASKIGPGGSDALYYNSTVREHIQTQGYSVHSKNVDTTALSTIFDDLSVYNTASNAITSLDVNGLSGSTVEFWLKKDSWSAANESYRQTVFDVWNGQTAGAYGRLRVDINFSSDKFAVEYRSGSYGISGTIANELGQNLNIATGSWNHYAVSFANSGSFAVAKLYRNGTLNDIISQSTSPVIGSVTGSMVSRLGSLTSRMPDDNGELADASTQSWGKLSGSVDEFRFWKIERTDKEISENWFTQVNGGTNSDFALEYSSSAKYDYDSPINLGVYYKFNEGIIGSSSVSSQDAVVLDYSGKAVNGSWTGYSLGARNTGSAMVLSNAAAFEFKDPILYVQNGLLSSFTTQKEAAAIFFDNNNNSSLYNSLPSWIALEDLDKENSSLKDLTQILGSYFDTLHAQIESVHKIKDRRYVSGTFEAAPFANRLINNLGLVNDEIFLNSSDLEYFASRNEKEEFEKKLEETKNLIYLNIYNNLINVFKSKGTEKSFRNLIRCFGVDDNLVRLNLYADEGEYRLLDNSRYDVARKKYVDFFDPTRFSATVFQSASATDTDSTSFISSNDYMKFNGSTYECEAFFPPNPTPAITSSFSVGFLTASIYGCHSIDGANENQYLSPDVGNFQVYALRENLKRKEGRFRLTGTAGGFIPEITTDVFKDVYDNAKWNFSVRVYPSASFAGSVTGSDNNKNYYARFTGYQYVLDDVVNSFDISSSMTAADAQSFLAANKRFFAGAHRTNFTGSVLDQANSQVSSVRVWANQLDNETLQYHAQHALNYGTQNPQRNAYLAQSGSELGLNIVQVPQLETLLMNWDYDNVTGSDSSGNFVVDDLSSGSLALSGRYGWFGPIAKYKYPGKAFGFEASSTNVYKKKFVNTLRQQQPETVNSSDMINIIGEKESELYTINSRPVQYYYSFEKSMYSIISDEILKVFATIVDFNNLIGEPVNKYRENYKKLTKLRQLYFERIENDPDFERFVEYYKWIDSAIAGMLQQLTPASAEGFDGMRNMVESHILERNKHRAKLPFIKQKQISLVGRAQTTVTINNNQTANRPRLPPNPVLTFGSLNDTLFNIRQQDVENLENYNDGVDPALLTDREEIKRVIRDECPEGTLECKQDLLKGLGVSKDSAIARIAMGITSSPVYIDGGSNRINKSKRADFTQNTLKVGSSRKLSVPSADIIDDNFGNEYQETTQKANLEFKYTDSEDVEGYNSDKGSFTAPFSAYSSSVTTGYISQITDGIGTLGPMFTSTIGVDISNYHDDSYGDGAIPMQGPFTDAHVGGRQARHQGRVETPITDGDIRAEEWNFALAGGDIEITTRNLQEAKALYLRDQTAKRPLNIKNIKWGTSSLTPGNYRLDYEMFQTSDRALNNRYFVASEGAIPTNGSSSYIKNLFEYELPQFNLTGANKSIIVERFSAPGGPETTGGGLDIFSGQYSAYNSLNFRNRVVRDALDDWATEYCGPFGVKSGSSVSALNYDTPASYFKVNRNPRHIVRENDSCATRNDNWWIQHAIPQSAFQYAWITASVSKSACDTFGYVSQFYIPSGSTSVTQSGLPFVTSGSLPVGSAGAAFIDINYGALFFADEYGGFAEQYVNQITSSENLIKPGTLFTQNAAIGADINAYLLNLNGPYQYPSWKQIRTAENPLFRLHKKQNILSVSPEPQKIVPLPNGRGPNMKIDYLPKRPSTFTNFTQPMVSFKFRPLETTLSDGTEKFTLMSSFGVNKGYFSQPINATTSVGEQINLFESPSVQFYDRLAGDDALIQNLRANLYSEIIYPRDMMTGLAKTRMRTQYTEEAQTTSYHSASLSTGSNGIDRGPLERRTFWKDSIIERDRRAGTNILSGTDGRYGYYVTSTLPNSQDIRSGFASSVYGMGNTPFQYSMANRATVAPRAITEGLIPDLYNINTPTNEATPYDYADTGELNSFNLQSLLGFTGVGRYSAKDKPSLMSQNTWYPTASAMYYHLPLLGVGYTNDTDPAKAAVVEAINRPLRWRVAELSGKNPWFNSYDEYSNDIRRMAKNYTVIPEFRMSQQMTYYISQSNGEFLSPNDQFLTLDGASITASAEAPQTFDQVPNAGSSFNVTSPKRVFNEAFFDEYSNSDFQKYFGTFNTDTALDRISLKCNAVKKLLPYNGFYPINRTSQLASMFSQSMAPYINGLSWEQGQPTDSGASQPSGNLAVQSLLQPYFAPGILYNTIKSGIGVSWGAYTGSAIEGALPGNSSASFGRLLTAPNYDIKFESILNPLGEFGIPDVTGSETGTDKKMYFTIPTYTVGYDSAGTGSFQFQTGSAFTYTNARKPYVELTGTARSLAGNASEYKMYQLAMSNFLAEIPNFFLNGPEGNLKRIVSSSPASQITLTPDKDYYMDIYLNKSKDLVMMRDYMDGERVVSTSGGAFFGSNNRQLSIDGRLFGPPVSGGHVTVESAAVTEWEDTITHLQTSPSFAPYTPPYFLGESKVTLKYTATADDAVQGQFDFGKFLNNLTASYSNPELESLFAELGALDSPARHGTMQISSSINFKGIFQQPSVEYDEAGNPLSIKKDGSSLLSKWVISPRMETPVLDFSDQPTDPGPELDPSEGGSGEETILGYARGMWSGYGTPSSHKAITFGIKETFSPPSSAPANAESLIDVMFGDLREVDKEQRVGELRESKEISEAIVAIPYVETVIDGDSNFAQTTPGLSYRHFFKLDEEIYGPYEQWLNKNQFLLEDNINIPPPTVEGPPSQSIMKMLTLGRKYMLPPELDFIYNSRGKNKINPFAMYIFEFNHQLSKTDLSDIWQGVMPEISRTAEMSNPNIDNNVFEHPTGKSEFFHGKKLPENVRWMVFKIKRRANFDYYKVTADTKDDARFADGKTFNVNNGEIIYSYNWPYDYFSLVELANLETSVSFVQGEESTTSSNTLESNTTVKIIPVDEKCK